MKHALIKSIFALMSISLIGLSAPAHADFTFLGNEIAIGGTITLKSGNILIVRNGTVDTRITVNQDTRLTDRAGAHLSYSDLELGDRIQAFGILLDARTLQADTIRDLILPVGNAEQTITGTVSGKLGDRVTVRSGATDIDLFLDQDTLILDRIGHRISLSGLEMGDRIQAFGALINNEFESDTITDLSIAYDLGISESGTARMGLLSYGLSDYMYTPCPSALGMNVTCTTPQTTQSTQLSVPLVQPTSSEDARELPANDPIQIIGVLVAQTGAKLTLLSGGETWSVFVDEHSLGFDKDNKPMSFVRMRNGDTLQVAGQDIGAKNISADAIRDLSISFAAIQAAQTKAVKKIISAKKIATAQSKVKAKQCSWVYICR